MVLSILIYCVILLPDPTSCDKCPFPFTVTSPNIARPLTLRTCPSDYATDQIKSFLILNIGLLLEREKMQKVSLYAFTAEQGWNLAKIGKCC